MANHQNSPFDRQSQVFRGIRFVLIGFDPIDKAKVSRQLVAGGGIDAGQYGPNCTHVIAKNLVYDDPICVAARRDGKILVSGLWADHSFDVGVPVDPTSVMYRPVRDLNGIPGAKSLVICLTGYQREDREDIMTMVDLMGANFSKPLIANKVTHLICYKFEGEKYLLAKKMKIIKLINHRWLEDCLKAWEILSEADYTRSGQDLEMEAEAKDSEDEARGVDVRLNEVKKESVMTKQDVSTSEPNTSASKGFKKADDMVSMTMKRTPDQFINPQKNVTGVTCEPSNLFEGTTSGSVPKKSPQSESRKVRSSIYSRNEVLMETTPPTTETVSNMNSVKRVEKVNFSGAFNKSSSPMVEKEEQNGPSFGKRKMDVSGGSSKLQKTSHNQDTLNRDVESAFQEFEKDPFIDIPHLNDRPPVSPAQNLYSNSIEKKLLSYKGKKVTCDEPIFKVSTPKIAQDKDIDAGLKETDADMVQQPVQDVMQNLEKSSSPFGGEKVTTPNTELKQQSGGGSSSKPMRRKSIAKKFSAPKQILGQKKTVSQKGSLQLENSEPSNDAFGDDTNLFKYQKEDQDSPVSKSAGTEIEIEKDVEIENMSENKSLGMDDETEPPEDKEEKHEDGGEAVPQTVDIVMEENASDVNQNNEKDEDISENVDKSEKQVISKTTREKKIPKKKIALSVKDVKAAKNKELLSDDNNQKPEVREEEATPVRASKRLKKTANDLDKSNGTEEHVHSASEKDEFEGDDDVENVVMEKKKTSKFPSKKNDVAVSVKDASDKKAAAKSLSNKKAEIRKEATVTPVRVSKRIKKTANDLDKTEEHVYSASETEEVQGEKSGDTANVISNKTTKSALSKAKKDVALPVKDVSDKKGTKKMQLSSNKKPEIREETTPVVASKKNANDLTAEGVCNGPEHVYSASSEKDEDEDEAEEVKSADSDTENVVISKKKTTKTSLNNPKKAAAAAISVKVPKVANKKGKSTSSKVVKACDVEAHKENDQSAGNKHTSEKISTTPKPKVNSDSVTLSKSEPMWFILTGHKLQRREFQQIIRRLKGKVCRVSHQWSYQATHFIVPDPIKRTEKFFAAAASGSWILKTDYLSASNEAGKFLTEEPYEWHKNGLSEDGQINLEAPRKWRLLKEKTGHGAFHGMRIVIYGECIAPTLDTMKRAVKAGDGTILATSPPYTRFLNTGVDYAIVSPGMPHVDMWVQEFIKHEIPCVSADYLVEYVCKPGYTLDRHVQFDTNVLAERSYNNLKNRLNEESADPATPESDDVACEVCGLCNRGEEMLICGSESGSSGCGVGMHIDCCDPPFEDVPEEDWFCGNCSKPKVASNNSKKTTKRKAK